MGTSDLAQTSSLTIISGIPAGDSGTGRFIAHLQQRIAELRNKRVNLIFRPEPPAPWQIKLWLREKAYRRVLVHLSCYIYLWLKFWISLGRVWPKQSQVFMLLHPQNLGYRLTLRLIESRVKPSFVYLLDSSFFCVASYNHLRGENGSCLRCLDLGFDQIDKNGCRPFPRPDWTAVEFVLRLRELVRTGRVRIAAQNLHQAELAQRHFGLDMLPPVVGLWTQDWDETFSSIFRSSSRINRSAYSWDVLFHGHCLDAKGASWIANVAEHSSNLRFMFPFAKPDWLAAPANCSFVPCTWENGLRDEIERSRFVIVPSLWSAPIEGALVKSIACAEAVIVVKNPTSFCDELPDEIVLKLSPHPPTAAAELMRAYENDWRPNTDDKTRWLAAFSTTKQTFVRDLFCVALGSCDISG